MNAPRVITVVCRDRNYFDVFEGETFCTQLTWDEMLGQVVHLTHSGIHSARYAMQGVDQFQAALQRHRSALAERDAERAEDAGDTEAAINARIAAWRQERGV